MNQLELQRSNSISTIATNDGRQTIIVPSSVQTEDDEKQLSQHQTENNWVLSEKYPSNHAEDYSSYQQQRNERTHPLAWVALFLLVVLRSSVSIFQNTFSPIPNLVADYLNVSLTGVNWLFNIQAILIIAGVITAAGCWVRLVAVLIHPPSFPVMMIGQVVASIGNPLTLNIMTKFAAVWFPENRRATAGMFVASNYGGIIAMFLMPAVATAAICTAAVLPQFILPAKPPGGSHDTAIERPNVSFLHCTLTLMKCYHFWILCGIHGINVGLSVAWGALLNQALAPYGYSDAQSGNIVAVAMAAGAMGALTAGPMLDITKRHKLFLKLMAPFMCSTYVALIFIINRDSFAAILYVNALNNFFLSFMVPVVVELGVEVSHPIPESISTSILWQAAQIVGFILVLVLDKFRDPNGNPPDNMFRGLVFQASMAGISVILSLIYNGPMRRQEAHANERQEQVQQ
ncbi:major facilitator superfamily domain-containing protein [Phascolomyces articulosus]|uniref:Major facilitator superfamily domain-containing protein n=1 Tax=Phascolomyces articulosus TaxID=60185 RepID=A0AAD5K8U9_9FUNG|nr:major facilitator superfamily domain-containing protein [Phascolomyces articulosus]